MRHLEYTWAAACSPPRHGGRGHGVAPRASLVAARTSTEEAVYELRQAALVEDL